MLMIGFCAYAINYKSKLINHQQGTNDNFKNNHQTIHHANSALKKIIRKVAIDKKLKQLCQGAVFGLDSLTCHDLN